jgi:hypothetical protein
VAYHLDEEETLPLLVTALGVRSDAEDNAWLRSRTVGGVLILKEYLHIIAEKTDRGSHVDIDWARREQLGLARELGFRPAPKIKGFRPSGRHLRQTLF